MEKTWNRCLFIVPGHASTVPTSLSSKCALMASPLICLGQYLLFYQRRRKQSNLAQFNDPSQNTEARVQNYHPVAVPNTLRHPKQQSNSFPAAFFIGFFPSSSGRSFPSTSSTLKIIKVSSHAIVWYSFPCSQGFCGQKTNPGQLHMLIHFSIDSSIQMIHDGINFSFHVFKKSCTGWKRSL